MAKLSIDKNLFKNKDGSKRGLLDSLRAVEVPKWVPVALVLAVIAVIAVVFWLGTSNRKTQAVVQQGTVIADQIDPNAFEVEVLPKVTRSFNGDEPADPFAATGTAPTMEQVKLAGVIINSNGKATAIVQAGGVSYIIGIGYALPESEWVVTSIKKDSITFSYDGNEKSFYIEK